MTKSSLSNINYINNRRIIIVFILLIFIFYTFYFLHNILKHNNIVYIENFDNNKIPKIIIHTWKTKIIPVKYKYDLLSCKEHNSDKEYEYKFYSDEDIDEFLEEFYPEWFKTYNKLPVKIQKIDFFRYIIIYHFGGFYLDLDITVFKNFNDLLHHDCIFPIDKRIKCKYKYRNNRFNDLCKKDNSTETILGQYAFAAKKNNIFIKFLIDNIHKNIDNIVELANSNKTINFVYETTGPDYVTEMYIDYTKDNNLYNKIHILESKRVQYFGEYAKHNFYGTWKDPFTNYDNYIT
jgi:mannosyltransferase OCH1-like enzyme